MKHSDIWDNLPFACILSDIKGSVIDINSAGEVLVKTQGQVAFTNAGQIQLASFPNDAGLESIGGNTYLETPASGTATTGTPGAVGFGTMLQGFLETSNLNMQSE